MQIGQLERVIEEIKQRLDLVEYVGRSVELKRAGRAYKALCPFHTENTASFMVFPHTGTWHCFGACGEGGDLFTFVQKREGLSFSEALQALAVEAGVELGEESDAARALRQRREALLGVLERAAAWFAACLAHPLGERGQDYLHQRGIQPETIGQWQVGYAPAGWNHLWQSYQREAEASGQEVDLPLLIEAGLVVEGRERQIRDYFRDRIIFPIRNRQGRVVGFGGRALQVDERTPKYLNSPQNLVFDKGRLLFGLYEALRTIRTEGRVVVTEGYLDTLHSHQAGISCAVATLGTALTFHQAATLGTLAEKALLALDDDEAGQEALERGLPHLGQKVATYVVPLAGHDPDALIREQGSAAWRVAIEHPMPALQYLIDRHTPACLADDPPAQAATLTRLFPLVEQCSTVTEQQGWLAYLARRLQTSHHAIEADWGRHLYQARLAEARLKTRGTDLTESALEQRLSSSWDGGGNEGYLLYLMWRFPDCRSMVRASLRYQDWLHPPLREIARLLLAAPPDATTDDLKTLLLGEPSDAQLRTVAASLAQHWFNPEHTQWSEPTYHREVEAIVRSLCLRRVTLTLRLRQQLAEIAGIDMTTPANNLRALLGLAAERSHLLRAPLARGNIE